MYMYVYVIVCSRPRRSCRNSRMWLQVAILKQSHLLYIKQSHLLYIMSL
jgi:hypothetical protein